MESFSLCPQIDRSHGIVLPHIREVEVVGGGGGGGAWRHTGCCSSGF